MRVLAVFLILAVSTPALATDLESKPTQDILSSSKSECSRTTSHLADTNGLYRGQRLAPRKLTELPSATAYMAVYRHIGDCEAPLTMVEYRNPRRR
jgi:hypothetical protein